VWACWAAAHAGSKRSCHPERSEGSAFTVLVRCLRFESGSQGFRLHPGEQITQIVHRYHEPINGTDAETPGGKNSGIYKEIQGLVHIESFRDVNVAINREKEIKAWSREKKVVLIEHKNPTWSDLAEAWFEPYPAKSRSLADEPGSG
jgi:hypothetical protein